MALYGAARAPSVGPDPVQDLTENSGNVVGAAGNDLPDLSNISVGYEQEESEAMRDAIRLLAHKINELRAKLDER